jgi:hypothetical protein
MWVGLLYSDGLVTIKKMKKEKQHFTTSHRSVTPALQWCITTSTSLMDTQWLLHNTQILRSALSIGKGNIMAVTKELVYSKFCASWVPLMVPDATATDLSCQCDTWSESFLSQIVMSDETWVHCFELESMQKSIDPQGRINSRVHSQLEKSWLQSFGMNFVLFLWTSFLVGWGYTLTAILKHKSLNAHHHQIRPIRNMS